jgi:hypothetical protein
MDLILARHSFHLDKWGIKIYLFSPIIWHSEAFLNLPGEIRSKIRLTGRLFCRTQDRRDGGVLHSLPSHYGSPIPASPSVHDQPADPPALISGTAEFPARSTIAGLLFFVDGKFLTRIAIANLLSLSDGKFSARITIANLLSLFDGKFPT